MYSEHPDKDTFSTEKDSSLVTELIMVTKNSILVVGVITKVPDILGNLKYGGYELLCARPYKSYPSLN